MINGCPVINGVAIFIFGVDIGTAPFECMDPSPSTELVMRTKEYLVLASKVAQFRDQLFSILHINIIDFVRSKEAVNRLEKSKLAVQMNVDRDRKFHGE